MRILITGGTGVIGRPLCGQLLARGHELTVLSRKPESVKRKCGEAVAAMGSLEEWAPDRVFEAVINLAGEPIFGGRWSRARKARLWDSRVTLTERLVERIAAAEQRPAVLISGSAVGYYGDGGDAELTETSVAGHDFGARLCEAWESAAVKASGLGLRVCLVRTGLVLSKEGGLLGRMLPAFRLGLGARLGNGQQWMSWIHIDDYLGALINLLENTSASGAYNVTAPNPVTNAEFTRTLAQALRRPAFLVAPAPVLRSVMGEMAELMLGGQRAIPEGIRKVNVQFKYRDLQSALDALLGGR